jgi:hypothetical protein
MKCKSIFLGLIFLPVAAVSTAQNLIITTPAAFPPLTKAEALWNITVVNSELNAVAGRIQVSVNDQNNVSVFTAISSSIIFNRGTKMINAKVASPISYLNNSWGSANELIKAGQYRICYMLLNETGKQSPLAEECTELAVEPVSPPLLNEPMDKGETYQEHPVFSWLAPAPPNLFRRLRYELSVVEILENQKANEALEKNPPIYQESNLSANFRLMPHSYRGLKENHSYAWQVTAYDNGYNIKSDVWQFRVIRDSVLKIIEGSPYIHLKINGAELGVMHQGYLKLFVTNYTRDTAANIVIREEGSDQVMISLNIPIKAGENFILQELDKKVRLDEKKIYKAIWVNSKGERWMVRYKPKYYR